MVFQFKLSLISAAAIPNSTVHPTQDRSLSDKNAENDQVVGKRTPKQVQRKSPKNICEFEDSGVYVHYTYIYNYKIYVYA